MSRFTGFALMMLLVISINSSCCFADYQQKVSQDIRDFDTDETGKVFISAISESNDNLAQHIATNGDIRSLSQRVVEKSTTPLIYALEKSKYNLASLLISRGIDCTVTDDNGATPLHVAASLGNREIATTLTQKSSGRLINAVDRENYTPLMRAVGTCNFDIIDSMLRYSRYINFSLRNSRGTTVLDMTGQCRSSRIKQIIEERMKNDRVLPQGSGEPSLRKDTTLNPGASLYLKSQERKDEYSERTKDSVYLKGTGKKEKKSSLEEEKKRAKEVKIKRKGLW